MPLYESWNYESGDKVLIRLFTNQPEAELFLNGKSLGARKELDGDGCMEWIEMCIRDRAYAWGNT